MARYTYQVQDLATGQPLADLPLSCTGLQRAINSDASATFTLDIADRRVRKLDPVAATAPGRVALFALRDDVPVWGGIIWGRQYRAATTSLTINAATVESYYRHRYWTRKVYYTTIDQFPIAAEMLLGVWPSRAPSTVWTRTDGSTFTGTNALGVEVDSDGVPVTVNTIPAGLDIAGYSWSEAFHTSGPGSGMPRTLFYQPGKNLYDAMIELMSLNAGFEWTCDPVRHTDGTLGWTSRFGYSQLGRHEDATGLQFDYTQGLYDPASGRYLPGLGSNILDYDYTDDAVPSADRVVVTGAETDAYIPNAVRGNLSLLREYPLLEASASYSDNADPSLLASRASGDLDSAALPVQLSTWTVKADGDMGLGTFQMGDRAVFAVSDLFTPRQDDGFAGRYSVERIVGWTLVPEQRGQAEQIQLVTNPITQPSARLPRSESRTLERFNRRLNGLTTTSAQGLTVTPVTYSVPWVVTPNQGASNAPGASVTVTDLVFTKTAAYLRLAYNMVTYGQSGAPQTPFIDFTVFDVASGVTLDNFFVGSNDTSFQPYSGRLISLSTYDYGDRVTLRVRAFMRGTYTTAQTGTTSARIEMANQTAS